MQSLDVDVIYRLPKDLCHEYIKNVIPKNSVDLVLYKSCLDNYINKKIIWKALPLVKREGVVVVEIDWENISSIINICKQNSYDYKVVLFYNNKQDNNILPFVYIYKGKSYSVMNDKVLRLKSNEIYEECYSQIINETTKFQDIVVLIGDTPSLFSCNVKNLCRYCVSFTNNDFIIKECIDFGFIEKRID